MEQIFNSLKSFILDELPAELAKLTDASTPLDMVSESDIVFGAVDISRHEAKVVCAILPDETEELEGTVATPEQKSGFTVAFLCRGFTYEILVRQMCRYAKAFRIALRKKWSLYGTCLNVKIGKTNFFPDTGTGDKIMTACETSIEVDTSENVSDDTDSFD